MPVPAAFPDPNEPNPIVLPDGTRHDGTVFLNRVIDYPNIDIGDFTYAHDFDPPTDWAARLAPYLWAGAPDRLRIGRYCQIASGVRFVTAGANHALDGLSTFPFPAFDPACMGEYHPDTRDMVIGNDVWIGFGAVLCPGTTIGNGVIVGAGAVVRGAVPDYAVVTGNPAQVLRMRFEPQTVARMNALAWWDWPDDLVARAQSEIMGAQVDALERMAPQ